jgi:nucleotide-binding universal stress UspA family protein
MRKNRFINRFDVSALAPENPTRLRPSTWLVGEDVQREGNVILANTTELHRTKLGQVKPIPRWRLRRVLMPLDGSPFAERAIPIAVEIARRAGAELQIVHVDSALGHQVTNDQLAWSSVFLDYHAELRRHKHAYIDRIAGRIGQESGVRVTPIVLENRDVAAALRKAASAEVDLVVMAAHGEGSLRRWNPGGTLDQSIRGLPVPLLVVGADGTFAAPIPERVRRILIALDGSRAAEQVLSIATTLGGFMASEYVLLRVVRLSAAFGEQSDNFHSCELRQARERVQIAAARRYMRRVAKRMENYSSVVETRAVVEQKPLARSIAIHAQNYGADLIALATRKGVRRQGSIADRVVQFASMPVLISAA